MNCAEIKINAKRSDCVRLVFIGDLHLGNGQTDEELIQNVATGLGQENTYWFDLGDAGDFINLSDRRFSIEQLAEWVGVADLADLPQAQVNRYKHFFTPYGSTCLARLKGNHEDQLEKKFERDIYGALNRSIDLHDGKTSFQIVRGTRALGYSGFVRLLFSRGTKGSGSGHMWSLVLYIHHGAGGGKLAGAKAITLERMAMAFDADVYAMAHTHTKMALQKRRVGLSPRGIQIEDNPLVMINTGSYMRGEQNGYAERKMLYPQQLGPIELWVYPDKKEIRVVQ